VLLTEQEYNKLIAKYGQEQTDKAIELLNNAIMSKGYKYKSHYHTIIGWPMEEVQGGKHNSRSNYAGSTGTIAHKAGKAQSDGEPYPVDFEG